MSSLLGNPGSRLPLDRAVDELTSAARWAGRPGWIWIAGLFYPSLLLNLGAVQSLLVLFQELIGRDLGLDLFAGETLRLPLLPRIGVGSATDTLLVSVVMIVPALLIYRLNVGLAAVAAPGARELGRERTLAAAWHAGKGQGLAALGMWLALMGLLMAVLTILLGPTMLFLRLLGIEDSTVLVSLLVAPTVVVVFGYAAVLLVLHMLAMESLAQNQRGVASALTHAWRLVRVEPWASVRACLVDVSLQALLVIAVASADLVLRLTCIGVAFIGLTTILLFCVAGVTRAAFWARVYRALGGPLATDRMPGMSGSPAEGVESAAFTAGSTSHRPR